MAGALVYATEAPLPLPLPQAAARLRLTGAARGRGCALRAVQGARVLLAIQERAPRLPEGHLGRGQLEGRRRPLRGCQVNG